MSKLSGFEIIFIDVCGLFEVDYGDFEEVLWYVLVLVCCFVVGSSVSNVWLYGELCLEVVIGWVCLDICIYGSFFDVRVRDSSGEWLW